MNYKNADNCKKCPKRNDELGCPWWWEFPAKNSETGQEFIQKQCGKSAMLQFAFETVAAANRPAAAVESTRNELATQLQRGFSVLGGVMAAAVQRLPAPGAADQLSNDERKED